MRNKNVFSGNIRRKWINLSQSKNSQKKTTTAKPKLIKINQSKSTKFFKKP